MTNDRWTSSRCALAQRAERAPGNEQARGGKRRRGVAVLIVLGMLTVTLALSYAMLRSQTMLSQLDRNASLRDQASQAARTGANVALRRIHESNWAGVDTSFTGTVSAQAGYQVEFRTGDDRLTAADPDYSEWPYRVTIQSTGWAADPSQLTVRSEAEVTVVVQLVRRRLATSPSQWATIRDYTLYQWSDQSMKLQSPVRAEGQVYVQGRLELCRDATTPAVVRDRYLSDLQAMRAAGIADHRPLTGRVDWAEGEQDAQAISDLGLLSVPTQDIGVPNVAPPGRPNPGTSYQLYPGGQSYSIPALDQTYGTTLSDLQLAPEPKTNPLGLFQSTQDVTLQSNVHLEGTLLVPQSSGDVFVRGRNVRIHAPNLPRLYGDSQDRRLPALIAGDDVRLYYDSQFSVRGAMAVWDDFEVRRGLQRVELDLRGNLVASQVTVRSRLHWLQPEATWTTWLVSFLAQEHLPGGEEYFPRWLETSQSLNVEPRITMRREPSIEEHWHPWNQPIFVPHPDDEGLRWEVVSWIQ